MPQEQPKQMQYFECMLHVSGLQRSAKPAEVKKNQAKHTPVTLEHVHTNRHK